MCLKLEKIKLPFVSILIQYKIHGFLIKVTHFEILVMAHACDVFLLFLWHFYLVQYLIMMQYFYQNSCSVLAKLRAQTPIFGRYNRPSINPVLHDTTNTFQRRRLIVRRIVLIFYENVLFQFIFPPYKKLKIYEKNKKFSQQEKVF